MKRMERASITAAFLAALVLSIAACSSNGGNRDAPAPDGDDGVEEAEGEPAGDVPQEDGAPDGPGCTSDDECGDGEPCNGREVCALDTGRCGPGPVAPAGEVCDDGNPLTTGDACDGFGLCRGTPPASCAALAAAGGTTHTCALLASVGVRCWGSNEKGQLGNGTQEPSPVPVDTTGLASGAAILGGGVGHTCAVLEGGGVKCWGDNYYGQIGDGTNLWKFLPTDVSGLAGGAVGLSLGDEYSCALLAAGGVSCWGDNRYGQLGDGTTTARTTPVAVQGLDEGASALAAGYSHTCAVMRSGGIRCWGDNASGQLGSGTLDPSTAAVDVTGLAGPAAAVAAGNGHTCALLRSGQVQCWGFNAGGQLGNGTTDDSLVPADVTGLASGAEALVAGDFHACVLVPGGSAACWGMNDSGQLGPAAAVPMSLAPTEVTGLPSGLVAVAAGGAFTCAITGTGGMFCWGANASGQLGNGSTTGGPTPVEVSGLCP
jgi:alpha-tubulin suppressor-like RCC1 family protein